MAGATTAIALTALLGTLSGAVAFDVFASCSYLECHPKGICVESETEDQGLRASCHCLPGYHGDGIRSCDPDEMEDTASWSGDEEEKRRGAFVYISSNMTNMEVVVAYFPNILSLLFSKGQSQCKTGYFVDLWLPGCSLDDLCLAWTQTAAAEEDIIVPHNYTDHVTASVSARIARAEQTIVDHVNRTSAQRTAEVLSAMSEVKDFLSKDIAHVKLKGYRRTLTLRSSIRRRLTRAWSNTTAALARLRGEVRQFSGATAGALGSLKARLELHTARNSRSLGDLQSEVRVIAANTNRARSFRVIERVREPTGRNETATLLGELRKSFDQQHRNQSQQFQALTTRLDTHTNTSTRKVQELYGRLEVHSLTSRSYMKQVADAVFAHSNNVTSHVNRLETLVSERAARARSESRSLRRQIKILTHQTRADVIQLEQQISGLSVLVQTNVKMTEMLKQDFMRWTDVTRKEMREQATSTDERLRVMESGMTLLLEQSESIEVLLEHLRKDACSHSPCQNGGTCRDHLGVYICVCRPGFTGHDCHIDIDECASNPCSNDARCIDDENGFTCICLPGWTGTLCETEVNECLSRPCYHGGTCVDHVSGFTCLCPEGATGELCETDVDDCVSQPCQNNGTCQDHLGNFTCLCPRLYTGLTCDVLAALPSCQAHRQAGNDQSDVFPLDLQDGQGHFQAPCRMDPDNSSWVVVQRRLDGSLDFYRGWDDYTNGFGNFSSEFWLGNSLLHRLTAAGFTVLRVELSDWNNVHAHALYSNFRVGNASEKFRLELERATYSGNAGNSMWDSNGERFTTHDGDHDTNPDGNCAKDRHGAWWYWNCGLSNLNGRYYSPPATSLPHHDGLIWFYWKRWYYSLKTSTMLIRQP